MLYFRNYTLLLYGLICYINSHCCCCPNNRILNCVLTSGAFSTAVDSLACWKTFEFMNFDGKTSAWFAIGTCLVSRLKLRFIIRLNCNIKHKYFMHAFIWYLVIWDVTGCLNLFYSVPWKRDIALLHLALFVYVRKTDKRRFNARGAEHC